MSNTYLSRIHIQDFRTFGSFEVDIPAAPGLVLLTGTNGLGKSNFFDAIEWALTGKIRRFTPYPGKGKFSEDDYLTRRGAKPSSHSATLTFSDGMPIQRGAAGETPMQSIIAQLAQTDRKAIHDLETYLALTHFLGQAAQQRFTSRDPQDQWQALKGPSGIERLEQVRSGLRGRPTTNAFTRRIDDQQSDIKEIERQVAEWQGWQARVDRLRQASRAVGKLTTDEVAERAMVLESELFALLSETPGVIAGETLSQRLATLGDRISQALQSFTEREATIGGLADTVGQFAAASVNARMDHPVLVRARYDVENARAAIAASTLRAEAANSDLAAQNTAIRTTEQEISILEAARSDVNRQGVVAIQIEVEQAALSGLSATVAERRIALAAAEATLREYAEAAAEVARLRNITQQAVALVGSYSKLLDLEAIVAKEAIALGAAREAASAAQQILGPLIRDRSLLIERIEQAAAAKFEAERHASAVSAAVATIASHVHDDDTNCPVCRTPFELGQLRLVANEAARSSDARLAEAATEIERLRIETVPLNARIDELHAAIAAPLQFERAWEASREAAMQARAALIRELGADVGDDLGVVVRSREQRAKANLAEAEKAQELRAAPAAAGTEQRIAIAEELADLIGREALALSHLNELRSEEQACAERIVARGMAGSSIESLNTRLSAQRTSREAASTQLAQLTDAALTAKSQLDGLRDVLSVAERTLAETENARADSEMNAKQFALRWTRGKLEGTPSQAVLDSTLATVQASATTIRLLSDRLQNLARDNQDLMLQDEIDEVVESMRAVGTANGISDPDAYLAKLREKETIARAALALTKEARKAVTSFTELLKARAEGYSTRVLAPLNGVIDDFNDAMLSTPGESIQFKADHRVDGTSFGMSLRYRDEVEEAIERQKNLPPQVVLSEGQLAANGFSILCAASTAYPWSRWRALLLDDPLQHNDIIHTAAFVDVMRNMVELQGYQLIMSSHDRAESDFIARKFDAAGLACSRIYLTAPSDKGVVYEGPVHNQAGKRVMQTVNGKVQFSA